MDTLAALHNRISSPRLSGEVSDEHLQNIFKAALRAPDHAQLKPWRFLIIKEEARNKLGSYLPRRRGKRILNKRYKWLKRQDLNR